MTFQEHMDDVTKRVDGLAGAAIADSDGIIVEEYSNDTSVDLSMLVAEYGTLWSVAKQAGLACELGSTREFAIFTDKGILVLRTIKTGYFLVFAIHSEKSFGKARFYARIVAEDLVESLGL